MFQRLLDDIQNLLTSLKIFVVMPKAISLKLDLSDTTYVEGDLKNIPLRANYVDLLIVTDMPKNEDIEGATEKRHRVVKNDGRITVL